MFRAETFVNTLVGSHTRKQGNGETTLRATKNGIKSGMKRNRQTSANTKIIRRITSSYGLESWLAAICEASSIWETDKFLRNFYFTAI